MSRYNLLTFKWGHGSPPPTRVMHFPSANFQLPMPFPSRLTVTAINNIMYAVKTPHSGSEITARQTRLHGTPNAVLRICAAMLVLSAFDIRLP